jgi:CspA family cold shock protein
MSYFDQPRRSSQRRDQQGHNARPFHSNRPGPRPGSSPPTDEVLQGNVKWFNAEKGFGFVALEDGSDVFLHGSVLARSGLTANPGDSVRIGVGRGLKGRQVTEILEVTPGTAPAERTAGRPRRDFDAGRDQAATDAVSGVVKWWNEQKGFGFITPQAGTQDIFVHASTAARAGLSLDQGMPVRVKVRQGAKGLEAFEIAAA